MRKLSTAAALVACVIVAASCGGPQPSKVSGQNSNSNISSAQTSIQHGTGPSNLGVASSHGGGADGSGGSMSGAASSGSAAKPPVETPELDAKIEKAEAKAKSSGASESDKKAAAAAYFERANYYRDQGMPVLYKFALADYRHGLRYDPTAREEREKMNEIVQIYQSMGRPVPELGNEP
ncbi:MAG: hypothetical protein QOJ70_2079 [Acidobacteriota bacterium]|jgi:hypothetical protein|nr:hypothetical protein [Acidobacteriota bacterium]